ncbi:hypothetical protein KY310_02640 [Candidatus Woesearchaeota archaeon]|nr:hypothetical protein [Candidatus Woesearchaeota archaeon]
MSSVLDTRGCIAHQKIFNTEVLIYDECNPDISQVLKNRIGTAILAILPKIKEVGYFSVLRINLVAYAFFNYYEFVPTPADLMKISPGSNFDVASYTAGSDPPVININIDQLYNFFLAARKQAVMHKNIIQELKGASDKAVQEIAAGSANEEWVYSAALLHTLSHEIAHAYQDKKTKLLKIQKRLKETTIKKAGSAMFDYIIKGVEEFPLHVVNQIVEAIEAFRLALQTEGTAEYIARGLTEQPDLKETYNAAVPVIEDLKREFDSFFFDMNLAGEITEEEMNSLLEKWREIEKKLQAASYIIGLHMVTLLSWKYSIEAIIKLSRFRFMNEYMYLARETSQHGLGFGPEIGTPLVAVKGAYTTPALLNLDDIKAKAIEVAEFQKKLVGTR